MEKIRFRSGIATGIKNGKSGIDKENGVIRGAAIVTKGEAKGHNMQIDDTMLNQVVELGNKSQLGIKSRFGHPNMSSDALGTFLGRTTNFHRDGDIVRADIKLDKSAYETPNGNLAKYVMDIAESDPAAFGTSIVFSGKHEELRNNNGEIQQDANGNAIVLARCEKLYAADVVDEPAANSGFFSDTVMPSAEMTTFLDKLLTRPDAVAKIQSFLNRYIENESNLEQENKEPDIMDLKKLTIEELKAGAPAIVEALQAESKKAHDAEIEALKLAQADALLASLKQGLKEGTDSERARVVEVLEVGKGFEQFGLSGQVKECVKLGKNKDEALQILKDTHYNQLLAEKNKPAGASAEPAVTEDFSNLPLEKRAQIEWDTKPEIRSEFGDLKTFIAFLNAEANGQVIIFKK